MNPRRALITGGAGGFGLGTAKALLAQGARVAIADIDGEKLRAAADELHSDRVLALVLDVTSPASVQQAVAACRTRFGGLDTLVNSAGVIHIGSLEETTEADWDRVIDIDLKGVFLCCQAAAPLLRQSGRRGRIVNIGSDVSKIGSALIASYCAAKFGVVGLSKALAGELAPDGVTVNCVCPIGVSTTGMGQDVLAYKQRTTGAAPAEILAATAADIPLGRNPTEDDVVNAIMFFLAEESSFLTGVALDVDGGLLSTIDAARRCRWPVKGGSWFADRAVQGRKRLSTPSPVHADSVFGQRSVSRSRHDGPSQRRRRRGCTGRASTPRPGSSSAQTGTVFTDSQSPNPLSDRNGAQRRLAGCRGGRDQLRPRLAPVSPLGRIRRYGGRAGGSF